MLGFDGECALSGSKPLKTSAGYYFVNCQAWYADCSVRSHSCGRFQIPAAKVRELFYTQKDKTIEFSRKVV